MADFAKTIYVKEVEPHKYLFYWEIIDLANDTCVDNDWEEFPLNRDELGVMADEQGFDPEEIFAKLDASNGGKVSLTDEF